MAPGTFSARQIVLYSAHRETIRHLIDPTQARLFFLSKKGTHVGLRAAVERGPSEGARSGSTGPTWVPFPSFSPCAFCEQEGHLAAPLLTAATREAIWLRIPSASRLADHRSGLVYVDNDEDPIAGRN